MGISASISNRVDDVRATTPLVHCITNYVTVESVANALLAVGGSPIMSDEVDDVEDITSICQALVLNIGTLNKNTIAGMRAAGAKAAQLGHPIVLDPVGAGASRLRTSTACALVDSLPVAVVRGNMSEIKALVGASASTQGVDVNPDDVVNEGNLERAASFARDVARNLGAVVAITGPIDVVADDQKAWAIRNGSPYQGRITGSGCMLSGICGAFAARAEGSMLEAMVAAVTMMGVAGGRAAERLGAGQGTGTFHTFMMDELSLLDGASVGAAARVSQVA